MVDNHRRSKNPQPDLGNAIRAMRLEKKQTQRLLAAEAAITVAHLSKIEHGYTNPTWASVSAIARALGVSVASVAARAETDPAPS